MRAEAYVRPVTSPRPLRPIKLQQFQVRYRPRICSFRSLLPLVSFIAGLAQGEHPPHRNLDPARNFETTAGCDNFGGMSVEEIGEALTISRRPIERDWGFAKVQLLPSFGDPPTRSRKPYGAFGSNAVQRQVVELSDMADIRHQAFSIGATSPRPRDGARKR
jgi:hypothetical protein